MNVPPLTWLFVPADRPDRVEKAIASEAHAVIVDLEDGVAAKAKDAARAQLPELLGGPREKPVHVRVNSVRTGLIAADLEVAAGLAGVTGIDIPKVDGAADVLAVLELLPPRAEFYHLRCMVESAAGVEAAYEIATSAREIVGIWLGEMDLSSELGARDSGLDWARSRIVNAAVAAGLPRPVQSVYPQLNDDEGLAQSCKRGRELGFLGRAAIHPSQLPAILDAYLPTDEELSRAQATIERLQQDAVATLADGSFIDAALLGGAQQIVALADRYGTAG